MSISHHDLCFGCGQANLFGLQIELERQPDGAASGRFFVKQDHQGPPGIAHGGVLAAALDEAIALLVVEGPGTPVTMRLEVDLLAPAPIGAFVALSAAVEEDDGTEMRVLASARTDDEAATELARARAVMRRVG